MLAFDFAGHEPFAVKEDIEYFPAVHKPAMFSPTTGMIAFMPVKVLAPELAQVVYLDTHRRQQDVIWQKYPNHPLLLAAMDHDETPASGEPIEWLNSDGVVIGSPEAVSDDVTVAYVWRPGVNRDTILQWIQSGSAPETNTAMWHLRKSAMHPTQKCVILGYSGLFMRLHVDLAVHPELTALMSGGWTHLLYGEEARVFMNAAAESHVLMSLEEVCIMSIATCSTQPDHEIQHVSSVEGIQVKLEIITSSGRLREELSQALVENVGHNILCSWLSRCTCFGSNRIRQMLGLPQSQSEEDCVHWRNSWWSSIGDPIDRRSLDCELDDFGPFCKPFSKGLMMMPVGATLHIATDDCPVTVSDADAVTCPVLSSPVVVKPWSVSVERSHLWSAKVGDVDARYVELKQTLSGIVNGWRLSTQMGTRTQRVDSLLRKTRWSGVRLDVEVNYRVHAAYRVVDVQGDTATLELAVAPVKEDLVTVMMSGRPIDWNARYAEPSKLSEDTPTDNLGNLNIMALVPMAHLRSVGLQYTWLTDIANCKCLETVAPGWTCDWSWLTFSGTTKGWDVLHFFEQRLSADPRWFVCAEVLSDDHYYAQFTKYGVPLDRVAAVIEQCQVRVRQLCDIVIAPDAMITWMCAQCGLKADPPVEDDPMDCLPRIIQLPVRSNDCLEPGAEFLSDLDFDVE